VFLPSIDIRAGVKPWCLDNEYSGFNVEAARASPIADSSNSLFKL
jgi:hypothetical protein